MAGDWIKMRASLLTSPRVNGIARTLEACPKVARVLGAGDCKAMSDVVTRNVMRNVTVVALLTLWSAANEHTRDGVFNNADLSDIDDMVGIPGFGDALELSGWAVYDADARTVTLPNFNEYNTCGADRSKKSNAERQRRYRERKAAEKAKRDESGNVTGDVTNNGREEKRREEITVPTDVGTDSDATGKRSRNVTAAMLKSRYGIDAQKAKDYLAVRKAKSLPLTETALEGVRREAELAGITLAQAIERCAVEGWAGFKAAWLTKGQDGGGSGRLIPAGAQTPAPPLSKLVADQLHDQSWAE